MTIPQKRRALLEETVKHFNSNNRSLLNGLCVYSGKGCAIGRKIADKKLCKEFDNYPRTFGACCVSNSYIFHRLPDNLKELGKTFLRQLQFLHDEPDNWNESGLTEIGVNWYNHIIDDLIQ